MASRSPWTLSLSMRFQSVASLGGGRHSCLPPPKGVARSLFDLTTVLYDPAVEGLALLVDGPEAELLRRRLPEHEHVLPVFDRRHRAARAGVRPAELPARAADEIADAFLRVEA